MNEKNLLEGPHGPVSQSIDAVKALLTWKGRAVDPLPSVLEFTRDGEEGRLMLILSNKRDVYYVTTPKTCSCPAKIYDPSAPCKHMRQHFGSMIAEQPAMDRPVIPSMLPDLHDTTPREAAYHSIQADKLLWPMEA
jgi:hypothetical protein